MNLFICKSNIVRCGGLCIACGLAGILEIVFSGKGNQIVVVRTDFSVDRAVAESGVHIAIAKQDTVVSLCAAEVDGFADNCGSEAAATGQLNCGMVDQADDTRGRRAVRSNQIALVNAVRKFCTFTGNAGDIGRTQKSGQCQRKQILQSADGKTPGRFIRYRQR